jgi:hypothetical protein
LSVTSDWLVVFSGYSSFLHQNRKLSSRISLQNQLFCLCRLPAVVILGSFSCPFKSISFLSAYVLSLSVCVIMNNHQSFSIVFYIVFVVIFIDILCDVNCWLRYIMRQVDPLLSRTYLHIRFNLEYLSEGYHKIRVETHLNVYWSKTDSHLRSKFK